jgi:hypothetical protein
VSTVSLISTLGITNTSTGIPNAAQQTMQYDGALLDGFNAVYRELKTRNGLVGEFGGPGRLAASISDCARGVHSALVGTMYMFVRDIDEVEAQYA